MSGVSDEAREASVIYVLEEPLDVIAIEKTSRLQRSLPCFARGDLAGG